MICERQNGEAMRLLAAGATRLKNLKRIIWLKWLITVTTAGKHRNVPHAGCQRKALQDIRNAAALFCYHCLRSRSRFNPLTVRRLCKALFGRTGSQWLVVEVLGRKGVSTAARTAIGDGGKMAARYRHAAELHWSATLAEIERVKRLYQTKIKNPK